MYIYIYMCMPAAHGDALGVERGDPVMTTVAITITITIIITITVTITITVIIIITTITINYYY